MSDRSIEPIDLVALYGKRYRIGWEETLAPGSRRDAWFAQILCRYGHIYVHSDTELGVSVDSGRVITAGKIRQLSCVRVIQDGDDGEVNAVFFRRDINRVFSIMRPRRRKQLSATQRKAIAQRLADARSSRQSSQNASTRTEERRSTSSSTKRSTERSTA